MFDNSQKKGAQRTTILPKKQINRFCCWLVRKRISWFGVTRNHWLPDRWRLEIAESTAEREIENLESFQARKGIL